MLNLLCFATVQFLSLETNTYKSFTLILQALDMYNTSYPDSERLIEETAFSGVILPSPEWKTLDHMARMLVLHIGLECNVPLLTITRRVRLSVDRATINSVTTHAVRRDRNSAWAVGRASIVRRQFVGPAVTRHMGNVNNQAVASEY
ncbi:unnamed protein product [Ceratitis capitata]|uniref:(Mediterranean fruit fly) hypothetical protein n=1 Tax=Ceratitis capitata TaxID=7213 RepID=A0A811UCB9_CERCA|nr:unnamed protein product [Ceratitis capitata]